MLIVENNKITMDESKYDKAYNNKNYEALRILIENSNDDEISILNKITKYKILENLVKINNYCFTKKILNYEKFNFRYYNYEEILSEAINKNNNIAKLLIDAFIENSTHLLNGKKKLSNYDNSCITLVLNIVIKNNNINLVKFIVENEKYVNFYKFNINNKDRKGEYPIFTALNFNNIEIFNYLIDQGANVRLHNSNGISLLILALYKNNYEAINTLTKHNVDTNQKDINGNHPLIIAFLNRNFNIKIFNCLLEHNADGNCKDNNGMPLLSLAIYDNNLEAVESLLKYNIDTNKMDPKGNYPIYSVILQKKFNGKIFNCLLENKANGNCEDNNGTSLLNYAIYNNNLEAVISLLKYDVNIDKKDSNGNYPIFSAILQNNFDIVFRLVQYGIKHNVNFNIINKDGHTPLTLSYHKKYMTIFKYLLRYLDINQVNSFGYNILYYTVRNKDSEAMKIIIEILVNTGVNLNKIYFNNESIIDFALKNGIKDLINILIDINYDDIFLNEINSKDSIFINKIILCKNFSNAEKEEIINKLIDKNYNINIMDKDGFTPLTTAIFSDNLLLTKALLNNGASINIKSSIQNFTPLDFAISICSLEIIKFLLEYNSTNSNDINPKSLNNLFEKDDLDLLKFFINKKMIKITMKANFCGYNDDTLLHLGVRNESIKIIEYLIQQNANPYIKNTDGYDSFILNKFYNRQGKKFTKINDLLKIYNN